MARRNATKDLKLCNASYLTPGPWTDDHWHDEATGMPHTVVFAGEKTVASFDNMDNAAFVAMSREALPYWIERCLKAEAKLKKGDKHASGRKRRAAESELPP